MKPATTALSTSTMFAASIDAPTLPEAWTEKLFTRLSGMFGSKLASLFHGIAPEVVKAEWGSALADFHPSEINRGLRACQTRPFAPVLGEFLRLCRPCLDHEAAWLEARHAFRARETGELGDFSHPAVWRAGQAMQWELRCMPFDKVRKEWALLLERELRNGWGDDVAPPLISIEMQRTAPTAAPRKMLPWEEGSG